MFIFIILLIPTYLLYVSVCLFAFCFVRLHVYTSEFLLIFCHAWFYLFVGLFVGDVGIMVADCSDEASLSTMCSAARIILNCVGPVGENFLSFTLLMAGPWLSNNVKSSWNFRKYLTQSGPGPLTWKHQL